MEAVTIFRVHQANLILEGKGFKLELLKMYYIFREFFVPYTNIIICLTRLIDYSFRNLNKYLNNIFRFWTKIKLDIFRIFSFKLFESIHPCWIFIWVWWFLNMALPYWISFMYSNMCASDVGVRVPLKCVSHLSRIYRCNFIVAP